MEWKTKRLIIQYKDDMVSEMSHSEASGCVRMFLCEPRLCCSCSPLTRAHGSNLSYISSLFGLQANCHCVHSGCRWRGVTGWIFPRPGHWLTTFQPRVPALLCPAEHKPMVLTLLSMATDPYVLVWTTDRQKRPLWSFTPNVLLINILKCIVLYLSMSSWD